MVPGTAGVAVILIPLSALEPQPLFDLTNNESVVILEGKVIVIDFVGAANVKDVTACPFNSAVPFFVLHVYEVAFVTADANE